MRAVAPADGPALDWSVYSGSATAFSVYRVTTKAALAALDSETPLADALPARSYSDSSPPAGLTFYQAIAVDNCGEPVF